MERAPAKRARTDEKAKQASITGRGLRTIWDRLPHIISTFQ
jgi:hypothetical protein